MLYPCISLLQQWQWHQPQIWCRKTGGQPGRGATDGHRLRWRLTNFGGPSIIAHLRSLPSRAVLQTHHPGWQEVVWDEASVLNLIQTDFPWFLSTYRTYPKRVQRSDVSRYMILYKYGGVYLDADVSCSYQESRC